MGGDKFYNPYIQTVRMVCIHTVYDRIHTGVLNIVEMFCSADDRTIHDWFFVVVWCCLTD